MRAYGWCTRCRKVKPVRVTTLSSKMPMGTCADCERDRRRRKTDR